MSTTGNQGLDALADAIAERVIERMRAGEKAEGQRLLNIPESARHLGMTVHALRHVIAKKEIPPVRRGRRVFCDRNDLDRYIEMRKATV